MTCSWSASCLSNDPLNEELDAPMRFFRVIPIAVATTALMSACSSPVGPTPSSPLTPPSSPETPSSPSTSPSNPSTPPDSPSTAPDSPSTPPSSPSTPPTTPSTPPATPSKPPTTPSTPPTSPTKPPTTPSTPPTTPSKPPTSPSTPPSSPSTPTQPAPPAASFDLQTELIFCVAETNRYRATLGLAPLTRSSALETYAAIGAREDGLTGQHTHQHFRRTSGGGIAVAENEFWGSNLTVHKLMVQGLAAMWAEGPGGGHYENMRGPVHTTRVRRVCQRRRHYHRPGFPLTRLRRSAGRRTRDGFHNALAYCVVENRG